MTCYREPTLRVAEQVTYVNTHTVLPQELVYRNVLGVDEAGSDSWARDL